ncbi:transposase [Sphaerisporangium fuscum]|uniref:transposase n=1 Tax=Sphaerisporangium fuscum TaxID=2835868 RepID=UPI001BDC30E9|nr:transposase [Sphaerisporangium fuscum]
MAGILRPGRAGSNTAADHITVLDHALAQIPDDRRYLLHTAARITRGGRRTWLRIAEHWPWARDLVTAFARLAALPRPAIC